MPSLPTDLRKQLENTIIAAREKAEEGALSALQKRAVDAAEPFSHFNADDKQLRNRLRARARQAGDELKDKIQGIELLTQELAYEYWHRMIFARFLAENHLLMHPDGIAVSMEECDELANTEGFLNGWALAAHYAGRMLPKIFSSDDVLLVIEFSPEHRIALEKLLANLPVETFQADDSLGWVYQFWQSKKKDDVNRSEGKIGAKELSAVTQLFTEDYMVDFLLHNTIGAWWVSRNKFLPVELPYLSRKDDGTPAAGAFDGWPESLSAFTLLDPSCGSGHFLVAALKLLVPLRMHAEQLSLVESIQSVLKENLFGLEIDPRCAQIAAFNLAFASWRMVGYCELPTLNIACVGLGPNATEEEWLELAEKSGRPIDSSSRGRVLDGLRQLYRMFSDAPTLGSLISPDQYEADMFTADFETLKPYLETVLTAEKQDDAFHERTIAAAGMVSASELLCKAYTLVATNVPYLGHGKQDAKLKKYLEKHFPIGKSDLATAFVLRCLSFCVAGGSIALVAPQNWLFLTSYTKLRKKLLTEHEWNIIARLGAGAFETIGGQVVNVALMSITSSRPSDEHTMSGIDVSDAKHPEAKAASLRAERGTEVAVISQLEQLNNPDCKIAFSVRSNFRLLSDFAFCPRGVVTGDNDFYVRFFWELSELRSRWRLFQSSTLANTFYGGREKIIDWISSGKGMLRPGTENQAYGRMGVVVTLLSNLTSTVYTGELYDQTTATIVPLDGRTFDAIWMYVSSAHFREEIRRIDQKLNVTPATLLKVPFDCDHWQTVASESLPLGLPEPESDDPTQWLFHGWPDESKTPLHVTVLRMLGYRWPAESDVEMRLSKRARDLVNTCNVLSSLTDEDGLVCICGVRGEPPAAERLIDMLRMAYGSKWSDSLVDQLLIDAGSKPGTTLDEWLRNLFFEQHCKVFQQRPFIWHIWDGRKDGFSALLNYHKLDYDALKNLTYSYLGDWISQQKNDSAGADLRLKAAQDLQEKLKLILAGEPPYDIFVRWKPLAEHWVGWNPDLNDGVRMNIRPFVEAGVLRKNPNIKWAKDRGKEPNRPAEQYPWFWKDGEFTGERVNDVHLTTAEKQSARVLRP